jgi:signal transduction histidine kinase
MLLGLPLSEVASNVDALPELLRAAARSTSPIPAALDLRHGNGQVLHYRVYASLVRRSLASIERLLFLRFVSSAAAGEAFRVMTERLAELNRRLHVQHRLQQQLETAREAADEANRSKSRFLAHMSHELRTPLNAILGFAEVIERELNGPSNVPAYATYARYIGESGRLLLSIIDDMLDLSKIEAGRLELHIETVDAPDLLERTRKLVKGLAHEAGVKLAFTCAPEVTSFRADPKAAIQMLVNLVTNAVKFTPEGGKTTVSLSRSDDGDICITVTDTGIGMSDEDIATALEPFGRVEGPMARRFHGTGLGLPLTKSLIEMHGGTLVIESVPEQGTTVTLSFPPASAEEGPADPR